MAQVILLGPNEAPPADADHLLLTQMRRPSGELVIEVTGAVCLPGEQRPVRICMGAKFASLEAALDGAQAYAGPRGILIICVRREE